MIQDLAAQNKKELLLWDCWGLMLKQELSEDDLTLLDKLATLTQGGNDMFAEVLAVSENDERLRVPPVVMNFSPVAEPSEVRLKM